MPAGRKCDSPCGWVEQVQRGGLAIMRITGGSQWNSWGVLKERVIWDCPDWHGSCFLQKMLDQLLRIQ